MAWALLQGSNSGYMLGMMITFSWAINLISFPFAGFLLDKYHKAFILFFSILLSLLSVIVFYYNFMYWNNTLSIGIISISILGMSNAVLSSAPNTIIPLISDKNQISKKTGHLSTINSLQPILGAILGGASISIMGVSHSFLFVTGTFLLSLLFIIPLFFNKLLCFHKTDNKTSPVYNILHGFTVIFKLIPERSLCLKSMVINSTLTPLLSIILPVYIKIVMEKPVIYFSTAEVFFGIGMFLGSFLAIHLIKKISTRFIMVVSSTITTGTCIILFALLPNIELKILMLFILGVCLSVTNTSCNSLRALAAPDYIRGRLESTVFFFAVLSIPFGSYIFSKFTLPKTIPWLNSAIVFMGIAIILSSLLIILSKSTRHALKLKDSELDGFYVKNYLRVRND